jgi:uracil-DNA glycosylase family protein
VVSVERPGASRWVPQRPSKRSLAEGIESCRGCELYAEATHGVPGEGPLDAQLMIVGEQPGDQEDKLGRPFVGPAGRLLAKALAEARVDHETVYRTNTVKHFRWERRGSNRLHKTPGQTHVTACGPWLMAEVDLVRPEGVVLLGATAGKALFGSSFRLGEVRSQRQDWPDNAGPEATAWCPSWVLATAHPSAVLRSRNRDEDYAALVEDLRLAGSLIDGAQDGP